MTYYKIVTFLSFLFFLTAVYTQEPLPKGLTEEEKEVYEEYIQTFQYGTDLRPPDVPPRSTAEFEEAGGVIVTWASYAYELREIVRHTRERVPVYIITNDPGGVQSYLIAGGVPLDGIEFVTIPYNSVWVRDYGPQSVYLDGDDQLAFIDWVYNRPRPQDNQVPYNMANYLDLPIHQMTTEPNRLVHTGGNLMFDGHGKAFSSKLVLSENSGKTENQIDAIMYDFMGVETYIKMDELPYDNISHLDMHMKLLDEETLLVGEFPEGVSDGPYIEANLQYLLDNYQTAYGRDFNVVRIPMVPNQQGQYPPNAPYRTYTNSLIINDLVLVPIYWNASLNAEAIAIYEEAMPGYEIVGINMESVIGASGAIHCISREIAAEDPIFISHASILEAYCNEPIEVEAEIDNAAGIAEASVFWSNDGGENYQQEIMAYEDGVYFADIPEQSCQAEISYYISATNDNNKTINKPLVAPDGTYAFDITCQEIIDFVVDNEVVLLYETVEYTYTGCLFDFDDIHWDFGDGADPGSAMTIGPHEVYYETEGYKTVTLTIDDHSLTKEDIVYVYTSYELVIETEGEGQTEPEPGTYYHEEGDEIDMDAIPDEGWKFDEWTDDDGNVESEDADFVFTMPDKDFVLIANFVPEEYELIIDISPDNAGNVTKDPDQDFYNMGDEINLEATAAENYKFKEWTGGTEHIDDNASATITVTMPADDVKLVAVFEEGTTVPSFETKFDFNIYPNPSRGLFNIVMSPADCPINIVVSDMQGRVVYQNIITNKQEEFKYGVNLESESPGIYLVRITWQQNSKVEKIMIR